MVTTRPIGDGRRPDRPRAIRVAARAPHLSPRTSGWMRLDPLQAVAWAAGLHLVVCGLVVLARSGFDDPSLIGPVVEVAGLRATPLLGGLLVAAGAGSLALATGDVDERALRIGGVLLGICGAVWLIEPNAFVPYLGIRAANGAAAMVIGVAYAVASFLPPIAIRRPGMSTYAGGP